MINICHQLGGHVSVSARPKLNAYFITQLGVLGWVWGAGQGSASDTSTLLFACAEGASWEGESAKGTSLFIFTIFLESFGERGKTGMFMKVSRWFCLHPQIFFSVPGPWRINQSQWQELIAKHCSSLQPRGNLSSAPFNSHSAPRATAQGKTETQG